MIFAVLGATIRSSVPLIFGSLGGLLSERAGVVNIALEGLMLAGAFAGAVVALQTGSPWAGLVAAGLGGAIIAAIYAAFVLEMKSDPIVAGTGINILALGLTPFFGKILYDSTGSTPAIPIESRFVNEPIWLALILVLGMALWFRYGASALWVRVAGEHPEALETAGIRVSRVRWTAVILSGVLAGIGGGTLSLFMSSSFSRGMTAGRGFMALAALIFGRWRPIPATLACLFFGLTDALQAQLQGVSIAGAVVPVQFIQILPYVLTVAVLAGSSKRAAA